ncbi:hypothetical protein DFH06DRAFT_1153947 [Mycena polygramma]|nr:hypothetical protein DFH06DRAFT_1153947 [Mycena polygramma]
MLRLPRMQNLGSENLETNTHLHMYWPREGGGAAAACGEVGGLDVGGLPWVRSLAHARCWRRLVHAGSLHRDRRVRSISGAKEYDGPMRAPWHDLPASLFALRSEGRAVTVLVVVQPTHAMLISHEKPRTLRRARIRAKRTMRGYRPARRERRLCTTRCDIERDGSDTYLKLYASDDARAMLAIWIPYPKPSLIQGESCQNKEIWDEEVKGASKEGESEAAPRQW